MIMRGKRLEMLFIAAGLATVLLTSGSSALAQSAFLPITERQKIEALISAVEGFHEATFIRNGKAYTAVDAARFLRGKWQAREAEIRSASDFIEKVGSFSSTTGKPYLIRFRNGREIPSALFLREQLSKIKKPE